MAARGVALLPTLTAEQVGLPGWLWGILHSPGDAALVDGAGRFRFFVQILLPLAKPAVVTVGLLAFVTSWNQYLLPLLVLQTSTHFTLPLGTYTFQTQYSQNDAGIMAFTALAMLPALGAFVFAQRYIVAGAAGAVKG